MNPGSLIRMPAILAGIVLMTYTGCEKKYADYPAILELVISDTLFSIDNLVNFCREKRIDEASIYVWNNHFVLYNRFPDTEKLKNVLKDQFPEVKIKVYEHPFYIFDRKHCANSYSAKKWDNIILTANLVKDTVMQKEYMEYHRTQFEEWPEVSRGFCNADFQQLLVFRNGRQLMLVISIPHGEDLDKLNPRTTENNPRVDEWNALMSKYQEGIEGAPPGTVWVFFNPLN